MSKNIVINIYGVDKIDIEKITSESEIKRNNLINSEKKYNLEIDNSMISDLSIGSRVLLKESSHIKLFDYNYFIYNNKKHVVEITNVTDQEIDFYDPKYDGTITIDLNSIYNLSSVYLEVLKI